MRSKKKKKSPPPYLWQLCREDLHSYSCLATATFMHSWSHEHHSSSFETTCTVFPGDSPVSCRISKEKGSAFICYHQFTRWDNSLSIRFCLPGWIVLVGKLLNYLIFTVPCWEWYCSNKSMIKTKYQVNTWIFQRAAHLLWHCIPLCKTFLYPTLNKIEVNHSNSQGTIILLLPRKKVQIFGCVCQGCK